MKVVKRREDGQSRRPEANRERNDVAGQNAQVDIVLSTRARKSNRVCSDSSVCESFHFNVGAGLCQIPVKVVPEKSCGNLTEPP